MCGAPVDLDPPSAQVRDTIGEHEHLILVLADGLGLELVEALAPDSFLRSHLAMQMLTVFPSSTAPALTSLASGEPPGSHGLLGWFLYLRDRRLQTLPLPFRQRFTYRSLADLGVPNQEVFGWRSLAARFKRDARMVMPRPLIDSPFTRTISGGIRIEPYEALQNAIDVVVQGTTAALFPSYTYFYYSKVDAALHTHGPSSGFARAEVESLDAALAGLYARLQGRARIVVSADHGGLDVPRADRLMLHPRDALMSFLEVPPSVEPRSPAFHVRPGEEEQFATTFRQAYGDRFALLTNEEVREMGLLGSDELSDLTRSRLGSFMGISGSGAALVYSTDRGIADMAGFHGGLEPREMLVPLVVA
jgi:hypothetical protein